MSRIALGLALLSTITACDVDLGPALAEAFCGGPCPPPHLVIDGEVFVGTHGGVLGESVLHVFDPADVATPVAEAYPSNARYSLVFGTDADPSVCTYLAKLVLWNGDESPLQPLVHGSPDPCPSSYNPGTRFDLPAYAPLDEPFVLTGTVYVDGTVATAAEAHAEIYVRGPSGAFGSPRVFDTDQEGVFRFETSDQGQWFWFCVAESAQIRVLLDDGREQYATLYRLGPDDLFSWGSITGSECGNERHLPDVRFGQRKAAAGDIRISDRPAEVGEVRVQLLAPGDSTILGEEHWTYDDGTFHVWFPYGLTNPGCDFLLQATVAGGASQIHHLLPPGDTCREELYHQFVF